MSNHLAIATVSAALRSQIDAAAQRAVPGTVVETGRPDAVDPADGSAAISVFLFQVAPNPGWRNTDLPTRRSNGELARTPQVALDLYYLLTFFGEENAQQPEQLLGSVVSAMHAEPMLDRELIDQVVGNELHLAESDLAQQVDLVRFVPLELNLEELSKLWSVFFQTAYRLSVAFKGSVVLIEPDDLELRPALPVRHRNLYVEALLQPVVEAVESGAGADAPIVVGSDLVLRGERLAGEVTRVALNGEPAQPSSVTATEVRVVLSEAPPFPADSIRAGINGIQILHDRSMGTPETAHVGVQSNVVPFVLRPALVSLPSPTAPVADYQVTVDPPVGERQSASLLLNGAAGSHAVDAAPRTVDSASISFDLSGIAAGEYLARVRVDGAESVLDEVDTDSDSLPDAFGGPTLEVT